MKEHDQTKRHPQLHAILHFPLYIKTIETTPLKQPNRPRSNHHCTAKTDYPLFPIYAEHAILLKPRSQGPVELTLLPSFALFIHGPELAAQLSTTQAVDVRLNLQQPNKKNENRAV